MNYLRPIFLATIIAIIASSCNHTIRCQKDRTIRYFLIRDFDTAVETTFRVVRYEGGSSFTNALDSTEKVLKDPFNLSLTFKDGYEYTIVLLPQNRRHTLKDINLGNEKRKGSPGLDSEQCHVSITFTYDGNVIKQPYWVNAGGGGYVTLEL